MSVVAHHQQKLPAFRSSRNGSIGTLGVLFLLLSACSTPAQRNTVAQTSAGTLADTLAARTDRAPNSAQQQVLDQLAMLDGKPLTALTPSEARQQPTPADAVKALLVKTGRSTAPEAVARVVNRTIPGLGGALPIRIYTPDGAGPFPLLVYFQGGGFVIANLDTYDASARALANGARAIVVSVEYRKAPEHKFPAAHDDAYSAYTWVVANGREFGGDTSRVALAGESAGGNLALSTAIGARDNALQMPVGILAVYPITGTDTNTESYRAHANAKPLSRPLMEWFFGHYLRTPADAADARLNLLAANLSGLPPTTILTDEFDPLNSDGLMIVRRLQAAGVSVRHRNFEGVAHEFFGQGAVVPLANEAVEFAAQELRTQFDR